MGRIFAIPLFVVVVYSKFPYSEWLAAFIFIIISLTDVLDGYLARKHNLVTNFGKIVDPMADKLLISAALIFLINKGLEAWMAFIIISREFAVTGLRVVGASKGIVIAASWIGKLKTHAQIVAIVGIIIQDTVGRPFARDLMLIAVTITIISGVDYYISGAKLLKDDN
jgi:CDP-diacylglycerol--glycerol-3-phosphate 3-phosphatidyltransferase